MSSLALGSVGTARPAHLPIAVLAGFLALSLAPVALMDVPAMVDYPNHLARMSVLARAGSADANPYYEVVWAAYPNLAMDLLVPPLGRLIGVETATRLFCLLAQILIVSGSAAIGFAVQRRILAAGISATLLLYSLPFAFGFLNFEFALGLGLWGIAAWLGVGPRRPVLRLALHAVTVAILFASHLFALGLYGAAIGLAELHRARAERTGLGRLALLAALMTAPVLVLAGLLLALGGSVGGSGTTWFFREKIGWLFFLNGFSRPVSIGLTCGLFAVGFYARRQGWLALLGPGRWIAGGFALLYLAMPFRLLDTAYVDMRVVLAAALILPGFVAIRAPAGAARTAAAVALAAIALANLGVTASVQLEYRESYGALVAALKQMPPGARILVAQSGPAQNPPANLRDYPIFHAATLAVHYANGFVPTLFTVPGKQPLLPRPAYRVMAAYDGGPVPIAFLADALAGRTSSQSPGFVADWAHDFDYICVNGEPGANPFPSLLDRIVEEPRFTLYRLGGSSRLPSTRP